MFILFSVCSSIFYETSSKISNLLRSYSGECLGSSSDEERSELRYAIWIAEFRELLDLWTHAAFWGNPVCSLTGVFCSFFRRGVFQQHTTDLRAQPSLSSRFGSSNASGAQIYLWSVRVSRYVRPRMMSPQLWFSTVVVVFFCTLVDFRIFASGRRVVARCLRVVVSFAGTRGFQTHNPVWLKLPSEFKHISKWWKRNDKGFFK